MANINDVIDDIHESDHIVQFYEQDAFLIKQAVDFVAARPNSDHTSIIIATKPHHEAIQQRLASSVLQKPAGLPSLRRFIALDADATLAEIMVHGSPHEIRFTEFIGNLVGEAAEGGSSPVRVFGEMVALLWANGQYNAALQLEELWNELGAIHRFSLFCAYPIQVFSRYEDASRFTSICGSHSIVRPTESFLLSKSPERVHRVVAQLQQKAQALEAEIARRKEVERTLRRREQELLDFLENAVEGKRVEQELDRRVAARTRDLVLSQNKLRALASQLSLSEQRVRKEVATELHDYLAQLLIVLRMKLFKAGQQAGNATMAGLLHEADRVLDESIMYTRSLMADLTPPILQFGLVMSLRWLAEKFRRHNVMVNVHAGPVHVELTEDQIGLLFQSVRELLMNVVKHGRTDRAQVSVTSDEKDFMIEVSDDGHGFDPSVLSSSLPGHDSVRQFGLFSIRERMEALGGRFELKSALGRGTRASLILSRGPKRCDSVTPAAQGLSGPSGVAVAKREGATRVLLVDDHAMVRQGLRSILDGYQDLHVIGEAADGHEAVELARALSPDVVVMDVNLPKIDGVETTRLIKAQQPSAVVIGLSVHQANQIQHMFKEAGASGYVTKDAAADSLRQSIISAVGVKGPAVSAERSLNRLDSAGTDAN